MSPPDTSPPEISPPDTSPPGPSPSDPERVELVSTPVIASLLGADFAPVLAELEELYGDELGDDLVLNELAEYLARLLELGDEGALERCCAAVEALLHTPGVDPIRDGYDQLLGLLPPSSRERLRSYVGEATARLLDEMDRDPTGGLSCP